MVERHRPSPNRQIRFDESPEDNMVSVSLSPTSIGPMRRIYFDEENGHNQQESDISDEQLFESYRGQQLHLLNQLMIMLVRQTKKYLAKYIDIDSTASVSFAETQFPIVLEFSPGIIKDYFPEEDTESLIVWSYLINQRIKEFPSQAYGQGDEVDQNVYDQDFVPQHRLIKVIDFTQLAFDVWNDWRFNQEFAVKRGIIKDRKHNANQFVSADEIISRNKTIWEDHLPEKAGEIEADAVEVLANWRILLSSNLVWDTSSIHQSSEFDSDPTALPIISLLLDVRNSVVFEQLINIRYVIDLINEGEETDALLSAFISGKPDVIVLIPTADGFKTVIVDIKKTLKEAEPLETELTKFQGLVAQYIGPGSKAPAFLYVSQLEESDLSKIEVYHVNPKELTQLPSGTWDFSSLEQVPFNTFENREILSRIIRDANLYPSKYKDRLARIKAQNRVPTKHSFVNKLQPVPRRVLPNISTILSNFFRTQEKVRIETFTTNEAAKGRAQFSLPGFSYAIRVFSKKGREKLKGLGKKQ